MKYSEIDHFYANPSKQNRDKLLDLLGQDHFKISDLGVTSRVFSNWKLKNVIPKVDQRQWVRLNLFEYFWIQIIKDMRALGLPLKLIARVKDHLFFPLSARDIFYDEQGVFQEERLDELGGLVSEDEIREIKEQFLNGNEDENLESFLDESVPLFFFIVVGVLFQHADIKLSIDQAGQIDFLNAEDDLGDYVS